MNARTNTEQLLELAGRLYDAAADPALWPLHLQELSTLLNANSAYLITHENGGRTEIPFSFNIDRSLIAVSNMQFAAAPPCARMMHHAEVVSSEELFPSKLMETTEIYNEVLKPQDIHHGMSLRLLRRTHAVGGLMMSRARGMPSFSDQDARLLRFFRPHLSRALKLGNEFAKVRSAAATLSSVVNLSDRGVVLLDQSRRVIHLNQLGSAIMAESDGLSLTAQGTLRAANLAETRALQQLIAVAAGTSSASKGGSVSISRQSGRPALLLSVARVPASSAYWLDADGARVVVFIGVQDAAPDREHQLRATFGLTRAEAAVASQLAKGLSPQEIAKALHVSLPTIRTHLRQIFNRTQVRGQVELVRLLAALPPLSRTPLV